MFRARLSVRTLEQNGYSERARPESASYQEGKSNRSDDSVGDELKLFFSHVAE
jgi:hypothetical protein